MHTRRRLTPEHMDDPHASRADLARALRFLRRINAWLGGTRASLRPITSWADALPPHETLRIIDLGAGGADVDVAIVRWARKAGRRVHITAVDRHPVTCELAREHVQSQGESSAIEVVEADALRLMDACSAGDFHIAHAGNFLHHLPDLQVMTALRIMDRLASVGVIWNDLVRVMFPRAMLWPVLIGAPAIVKHDAIVSMQAGFRRAEAIDLAIRAGWRKPQYRQHLLHRFTLVESKG